MIVENQESLKTWLTAVLQPLCDADPAALARYVIALVKKDKPEDELKNGMVDQLDVFLLHETKGFVETLFNTLQSKSYLETNPVQQPPQPPISSVPVVSAEPTVPTVQVPEPTAPSQTNGTINVKKEEAPVIVRSQSKSDTEDKGHRERLRTLSPRARSRSRSRSHSWERSRINRDRDHARDRSRDLSRDRSRDRSRGWENSRRRKSPRPRRYERRRSWSRSKSPRNRSLSPRPRSRGFRSRTRSRSRSRTYSRSPHATRSPPRRSRSHSNDRLHEKKEPLSGGGTPTQDSNHGDVDLRLNTTSQSIQSVISAPAPLEPAAPAAPLSPSRSPGPVTPAPSLSAFQGKRRCRDYDEKGFCMRGDLCPYDHGNDPVVLEDVALSQVLSFGHGPTNQSQQPPMSGIAPRIITPSAPILRGPGSRGPPPVMEPYNPETPIMEPRMPWGRPPFRGGSPGRGNMRGVGPRQTGYGTAPQRELISVPVVDETPGGLGMKRPSNDIYCGGIQDSGELPKRRHGFDFNRLGPRRIDPNNCSLELKKVPRGLNNITHLNNHFSKFGKIINIQVNFEGDPEAALITFSSHAEANAAYRSTEAVLNNRFIKVFWHNKENSGVKVEPIAPYRPSVKERLGTPHLNSKVLNTVQPKANTEENEKVIISGNSLTKTVYNPTALHKPELTANSDVNKAQAAAAIKKSQEILAVKETIKKKREERRGEAMKLQADLQKRKQELLDKQLQQQRLLIEKLEKGRTTMKPEEKETVMTTIKTVQESIENIRKDLNNAQSGTKSIASGGSTIKKTKEQAQKEILDAELDLYTRQQEGGDTFELQRRVNELKLQAHAMGLITLTAGRGTRGRGRGRGARAARASFRGRGRGFANALTSVDRRPTKLLVSGYESDEKMELLAHFAQFGEIIDYVSDDSTPSLLINFKVRKEAEVAMAQGRHFGDRTLSVTWGGIVAGSGLATIEGIHSGMDDDLDGVESDHGGEEEDELVAEDLILQDDEEEEDEDRSWRR